MKNNIENLSSQLNRIQQESSLTQQNLYSSQNQLSNAQRDNQSLSNQLSQMLSEQATLNAQLNTQNTVFSALTHLFDQFRVSKGITLNPNIVITQTISAEELAHTDIMKEACKSNYKEGFDLALTKITNINFQDSDGRTVLMHAIINSFYYGAGKLLEAGADVNILDNKGMNALLYCAQNPHVKYIKLIADKTADIEHKDSAGNNALHYLIPNLLIFSDELMGELKYADTGHYGGCKLIVNCDFTISSILGIREDGYNVQQEKSFNIIKYLTNKGIDINSVNAQGQTAFFIACNQGLLYLSRELLKQYRDAIDYSIKDSNNNTYLHYASRLPDAPDIIELMLSKIDINAQNIGGGTAILQASVRNSVKNLELLIQKNGDLSICDIEGRHSWHYASQYGAIDVMKFLKSKIPNVIELRTNNQVSATALHIASEVGNLTSAKWLIDNQADINSQTRQHGLTPFFIACMKKNLQMAELFFNNNKFINYIVDKSGFGTLHWGLELRNIAILQRILDKGIDINLRDNEGKTALFWAVQYNWLPESKFLLEHHANPNIADNSGIYPLHFATHQGFIDLISLLSNYANINLRTTDQDKFTALYLASQDGKLDIVKILANKGADLDIVRENNGMPPLHVAMQKKHIEVAQELLAKGAGVNIVDLSGWMAIHWAASLGDVSIVASILGKNTNINARNSGGGTPLYIAVYNNNKPMAELLLSQGANTDIADNNGTYPWHIAAFQGYLELMKVLRIKVSDIDCKTSNIDKYTALWLASQEGKLETVKWLIDDGADINYARESDGRTALQASICKKFFPVVQELVSRGCEVNKGDAKHYTPLYYATELQELKIIKFLIEHGANVTLAGDSGDQPLHMAAMLCNVLIVKMLLEAGANIDAVNNSGNTALHEVLLEENKTKPTDEKLNALKYLLAKSARIDIKNGKEETVIDLAKLNFPEALNYLEHPENIPLLHDLESNLVGLSLNSELII
jgi:ankyrin repeat protein